MEWYRARHGFANCSNSLRGIVFWFGTALLHTVCLTIMNERCLMCFVRMSPIAAGGSAR